MSQPSPCPRELSEPRAFSLSLSLAQPWAQGADCGGWWAQESVYQLEASTGGVHTCLKCGHTGHITVLCREVRSTPPRGRGR